MQPYPGPPPFYQGRRAEAAAEAPRASDGRVTVALVLGIVSMVGFAVFVGGIVLGVPAVILGALGRRDARRDPAAPRTGGANIAIVTGTLGVVLNLVFAVVYFAGLVEPDAAPPIARATYTHAAPARGGSATATAEWGPVHLVDLDAAEGPLHSQLAAKSREAKQAGAKLLVMTAATWSKDSREIALTLSDPSMQLALTGVWVVRVNINAFKGELETMKIETDEAPLFILLGGAHEPIDAIGAEAWEANDAESLAPVLHAFVHGKLPRRDPAPPARGGGTSL